MQVEDGSCHVCKKQDVKLFRNAYGYPMEGDFLIDDTKGVIFIRAGGLKDDPLYSCSSCGAPLPQYGTIEEVVKTPKKSFYRYGIIEEIVKKQNNIEEVIKNLTRSLKGKLR